MKVLLGFSGGVDSAVAAYLLKKNGYEVTGCFMRNWDSLANNDYLGNPTLKNDQCSQEIDYEDAKIVAKQLGIELLRIDFVKEYWDNVFSFFLKEYEKGRTPNPDILCNKYIKFDAFLNFAKSNGFDKIAMGHYADKIEINGTSYLKKCLDQNKDQTYFLAKLTSEQISSCIFPLSNITKEEIREIAKELNLYVANKKDSTGVCFIGERNFKLFLNNYLPAKKGDIVDIETNKIVGSHNGVFYYTIGQHKGLGIGGIKGEDSFGWIVVKKNVKENILYVCNGNSDSHLMSNKTILKDINIINKNQVNNCEVKVKFRYRQKDHDATMNIIDEDTIELLYSPYKAVTAGQEAVIYKDDILIACGTINDVYFNNKKLN